LIEKNPVRIVQNQQTQFDIKSGYDIQKIRLSVFP